MVTEQADRPAAFERSYVNQGELRGALHTLVQKVGARKVARNLRWSIPMVARFVRGNTNLSDGQLRDLLTYLGRSR